MSDSVADVSDGLHVNVVVMERLWIRRRSRFRQEDTEPPPQLRRAARLQVGRRCAMITSQQFVRFSVGFSRGLTNSTNYETKLNRD